MRVLVLLLSMALGVSPARALVFDLDYTYDGGFFSANPTAKTALEQAAADLGAVIGPTLGAVPGDTFAGTRNATTVTFNWRLQVTDPSDGVTDHTIDTFSLGADVFRLYVGARLLSGSTLGEGGGVGLGFSLGASGFPADAQNALATAAANSQAGLRGNAGPVGLTFNGSINFGGTLPYSVATGSLAGTLAFDLDTAWHFDVNSLPSAGESDFYSVALHEMLHALGVGSSETWTNLVAGTNWSGPAVGALTGGGTGVINADGSHLAAGIMSVSLATGLAQEAAMDPTLTTGTRKTLTALDAAILSDLGYNVVPEPGTLALCALAAVVMLARWRRRA